MANPNLYLYCEHTNELVEFNKAFFNEYEQAIYYKMLDEYIYKHLDNNDVVFLAKDDNDSFINTGVTLKDYFINQNYVFSYEEFLSRVPVPNNIMFD